MKVASKLTVICTLGIGLFCGIASVATQQATNPRPEFEVASIKLNRQGFGPSRLQPLPGGRLVVENAPLRMLIMTAYDIPPSQILGGPTFGPGVDLYDIQAKAPEGSDRRHLTHEMLQTLLENRFGLKYHWITEQRRVYQLTVDKSGPKIKHADCVRQEDTTVYGPRRQSDDPVVCGFFGAGFDALQRLKMIGTIAELAHGLSTATPLLNVIDRTGLEGTFEISLQWTYGPRFGLQDPLDPDTLPTPPSDGGQSIFDAVKQQLGLKLERTTGPVTVMVIDHLEKPSEN
jgi:uncharacterized protein (TIGR03435 family)